MITMSELLEDKAYRDFMLTPPRTPKVSRGSHLGPMWVVYLQKRSGDRWRRKAFPKYKDAFKFMRKALKLGYHDAAINNKRVGFDPPTRMVRIKGRYVHDSHGHRIQVTKEVEWKPKLPADESEQHFWCRGCRRPTVWGYYSTHPAIKLPSTDPTVRRCRICGGSERINMNPNDRRV